jgi:Ca-activated chloride channel family protein
MNRDTDTQPSHFLLHLKSSAAVAVLLIGVLAIAGCDLPTKEDVVDADANAKPKTVSDEALKGDRAAPVAVGRAEPAAAMEAFAPPPPPPPAMFPDPETRDKFPNAKPNPVKLVTNEPVSTFSADVDTASYSVVRKYLTDGALPPADAVRIEEMVNYFDYNYALPDTKAQPFRPSVHVVQTPWNPDTQIVHIGIKGFDLPKGERPPANLVFLLDVSGSMDEPNKLPLVKKAMSMLVQELDAKDRLSIVVYAGAAGTVLQPTPGSEKAKILAALDDLTPGGSTAGAEGIRQA